MQCLPDGNILLQLIQNQLSRLLESFGLRAFCQTPATHFPVFACDFQEPVLVNGKHTYMFNM